MTESLTLTWKNPEHTGTKGNFLQLTEGTDEKLKTANGRSNGSFPHETRKKTETPLSLLLLNVVLEVLVRAVSQEKDIKSGQTGREFLVVEEIWIHKNHTDLCIQKTS